MSKCKWSDKYSFKRELSFPPRSRWELRSRGLLRSEYCYFITDLTGPRYPETSVMSHHHSLRNKTEQRSSRLK